VEKKAPEPTRRESKKGVAKHKTTIVQRGSEKRGPGNLKGCFCGGGEGKRRRALERFFQHRTGKLHLKRKGGLPEVRGRLWKKVPGRRGRGNWEGQRKEGDRLQRLEKKSEREIHRKCPLKRRNRGSEQA